MKRRELVERLEATGCKLVRHGAKHDWYRGEIISSGRQLVSDLLDAENASSGILALEPLPERGTEVHPVMPLLGLAEDVGVEKVGHQGP